MARRNKPPLTLRTAAIIAAGLLGIPTAAAAFMRISAVAAGDITIPQALQVTFTHLIYQLGVVAAIMVVSAWGWRTLHGGTAAVTIGIAAVAILTVAWAEETSQSPLKDLLYSPTWLGWAVATANTLLMLRWWSLATRPPEQHTT